MRKKEMLVVGERDGIKLRGDFQEIYGNVYEICYIIRIVNVKEFSTENKKVRFFCIFHQSRKVYDKS